MKICVAIGLLVLASLHGASAVAEPIGPRSGSSSTPTSCDRCAACRKNIKPADKSSPTQDETNNSQRAAQCQADCADCAIRGEVPTSVPATPIDPAKAKQ